MPQSRDYSGFFDLRHIQGVVNDIKYFFLNIEKELEKRGGGCSVRSCPQAHVAYNNNVRYSVSYLVYSEPVNVICRSKTPISM